MSVSQAAQRRTDLPNIGHRTLPKIWVGFLYAKSFPWAVAQGNDFELVRMVKNSPVLTVDSSQLTFVPT